MTSFTVTDEHLNDHIKLKSTFLMSQAQGSVVEIANTLLCINKFGP